MTLLYCLRFLSLSSYEDTDYKSYCIFLFLYLFILMKGLTILLLITFLIGFASSLQVTSVKMRNQREVYSSWLQGSIMGGTKLYFEGLGFSTNKEENIIYIGNNPCIVEDGVTDTSLVCQTTAPQQFQNIKHQSFSLTYSFFLTMNDPLIKYQNLQIVLIVGGSSNFQGSLKLNQRFSYSIDQTPIIYGIYPSVSYAGEGRIIKLNGIHRNFNFYNDDYQGDIHGVYIGKTLCSRASMPNIFEMMQMMSEMSGSGMMMMPMMPMMPTMMNSYSLECQQPIQQKAGKYEVSQHLFPGRSTNYILSYKATLNNNENFQFVVLPLVNSTTQSGSVNGQNLVIKGSGFSTNPLDINVDVDGVNCKVTESTLNQVQCRLEKKATQSASLTTNAASSSNNYNSGAGFFYQRHNLTGIQPKTLARFKELAENGGLNSSTLLESYISTQIKSQYKAGEAYGEVWRGYFLASATGNYKFRGQADGSFAVYLNKNVYGSKVSFANAAPIVSYDVSGFSDSSSFYSNYINDNQTVQSQYINLEAGKQYYMEIYHLNISSSVNYNYNTEQSISSSYFKKQPYFSLSVQVPNTDQNIEKWQTYEIQTIKVSVIEEPEIIQFTSKGATFGSFNISYSIQNLSFNPPLVYSINATIPYDANASVFCKKINQLVGSYIKKCQLKMKDQNGVLTSNKSAAIQFIWRIIIYSIRPKQMFQEWKLTVNHTDPLGNYTMTTIQQHSPPLGGDFKISIGDVPIKLYNRMTNRYDNQKIPLMVQNGQLQDAFRQINGFEKVKVERIQNPLLFGWTHGSKWVISFIGFNQDVPQIVVDGSGLVGGSPSQLQTNPKIEAATRRQYNSNLFVDPVDYRWMRTFSDKPNVRVTVDGIPSVCYKDCRYTFINSVPVVTAASLTGSSLSISLANTAGLVSSLNDISVTLDEQPCMINQAGTVSSFSCALPVNSNGDPKLKAGQYLPVVNFVNFGLANISPQVIPIIENLLLTNVSPTNGGINGGYQIVITGKGFPASTNEISINLCNKQIQVISVSNIQATFLAPSCTAGTTPITVAYGSYSQTINFTYEAVTSPFQINTISPTSWSPVMKGVLEITGLGFGNNPSLLKVFLTNSTGNIYQMKILSVTDNLIKAGIPGGLPGIFDVNVIKTGFGNAIANPPTANDFAYEVYITSITPNSGSIAGGTLITIIGKNFVPDALDTMVTIGNELNQICRIETISSTEIKCRTPPKSPYYAVGVFQEVTVDSKLIIPTNCTGTQNCWFKFMSEQESPILATLSSITNTGSSLTLTGERFTLGSAPTVSFKNKITGAVTEVTPTVFNDTQITINLPQLQAGYYDVKARTDPIGESNSITFTVQMNINNAGSTSQISVKGGIVKILGSGFPASWPNQHYNQISLILNPTSSPQQRRNIQIKVAQMTKTQIRLQIPEGKDNSFIQFKLTTPMGTSKSFTFNQRLTATPKVAQLNMAQIPPATQSLVTLNRTQLSTTFPQIIRLYSLSNPSYIYNVNNWQQNGDELSFNVTLNSGKYGFKLFDDLLGWYSSENAFLSVSKSTNSYSVNPVAMSFNGGLLTVTGQHIGDGATITVNGFKGKFVSRTSTQAVFSVPKFSPPQTAPQLKIRQEKDIDLKNKHKWGDAPGWQAAFDSQKFTMYQSSNTQCYIGVDIGNGLSVQLTRIRYFPNHSWKLAYQFIRGAQIQVSNDNSTWTTLVTIDQKAHKGWNTIKIQNTNTFRYVRFLHNTSSKCNIAELQITGIIMNDITQASTTNFISDVYFDDGLNQQTFTGVLQYRQDKTPIITEVNPISGNVFGGYDITLTGVYLDIETPTVNIDGVPCVIKSLTATQIICTVGSRLTLPNKEIFEVMIGSKLAITNKKFQYVMRWSDPRTWGTDIPPIDGDLVYIPAGMHLLVDQSTPILKGIVVENGTIQFSDEIDMEVRAEFITLRGGEFIAGTEEDDYDNKLTFTMYGNYYSPQQPTFGNKGIGCLQCKFSMIGKKRTPTWTTIANTINIGDNQLTVTEDVDWQVGEHIVVASTSFDHKEAEQRIITAKSGRTLTVDSKFKFKHYAGVENYDSDTLEMRAEVGLLTRNIVMKGDDNSVINDYGSHLMLTGSSENGLVAKIAYTQFTKCGQPQIEGRYCQQFKMIGDASKSYSIGNSVHHSMARVIALHGVHYLNVAWNVGYQARGHNFYIKSGVQTNNVLEYNLAISSLYSSKMMQSDTSVASFWVSHPSNHLRNNRAAGSDFYGFWYQINERPAGASPSQDICPLGNSLGESHDNIAHSNARVGLKISKLLSRKKPCQPLRNDNQVDPWINNPSVQSIFSDYLLWKNGQTGLLAQQVGNTIFENFKVAENKFANIQFQKTSFTKEHVIARNILIVGKSRGNLSPSGSQLDKAKGAILSRAGQMKLEGIKFYDFTSQMTVWQACSKCNDPRLYTNIGATYYASSINYRNITGKFYNMLGLKRQIFYDLDGSLTNNVFDTNTRTSATLTFGWPHLLQDPACQSANNPIAWSSGTVCNQSVTVRKVIFANLDTIFRGQLQNVRMINSQQEVVSLTQTFFTKAAGLLQNQEPLYQIPAYVNTYSLPYLTDRIYQIWWSSREDFDHLTMVSSHLWEQTDKATVFKFKYIDNREFYDIYSTISNSPPNPPMMMPGGPPPPTPTMRPATSTYLNRNTCENGDYYHNNADNVRVLHLCASGKKTTKYQHIQVKAIYCRISCPAPLPPSPPNPGPIQPLPIRTCDITQCTKQDTIRLWSNATQWPNQAMPAPGDRVTICCQWTMIMDIVPEKISKFQIYGDLIIGDDQDITIQAQNIWIKGGLMKAGYQQSPFSHNLKIQLNGQKNGVGFTVNSDLTGNKMFVNTGRLQLLGKAPDTIWTKMTAFADIGATSISVENLSGWKVGDQIGIAPSFTGQKQFQKVTITQINQNIVTFTPPLQFAHFGDANPTIVKQYGTLDMRTGVGLLSRNIKIVAGSDTTFGFTFIQFGGSNFFMGPPTPAIGKMKLIGVQFIGGGQQDTEKAALQILNIQNATELTSITKSSFHQCQDFCMRLQSINNLSITNNVFFNAQKYHVLALKTLDFNFTDNLLIGVTKRSTINVSQLIGCFASYESVNPQTDKVLVKNNLCQGSEGNGFVVPDVSCDDIDIYPFAQNTAGSCNVGWIFARGKGTCLAAKGIYAYGCQIGHIMNPPSTVTTKFKNFILADNGRSLTFRIGGTSNDKTAYMNDSFITAIARPGCVECYGETKNDCTGNHGIRMLALGQNGRTFPLQNTNDFDRVLKSSISGKTFIYNTEFSNFRQTYPSLPQCSNNVVFKPNPNSPDITGSHHLFNSNCTNCQLDAYAHFSQLSQTYLGRSGGCGQILCTGMNNYFIHDHTGTFLPTKGILLANNSWIGDNTPSCAKIPSINGHYCTDEDFGVLEYESVAPDFNTRIMWPVQLKFDGGNWTSVTNAWREWDWNGAQPLNKRLARFVSVVKLHQMYNMTFTSMPPEDMTFKMQKRLPEGNSTDWVIVKLMYPKPNSIRVKVGDQIIKPITFVEGGNQTFLDTSLCGSNKYFFKNYTVHFVVTGDPNCMVRVSLTNNIQLTTKFEMKMDDFLKDDGATKFINRLAALLKINDTSRIKIVGVYPGSVNVITFIEPEPVPLSASTTNSNAAQAAAIAQLQSQVNSMISSGTFQQAMQTAGLGKVIGITATVALLQEPTTNNNTIKAFPVDTGSSNNKVALIVGVVVGVSGAVILLSIGVFCYIKKKSVFSPVNITQNLSFKMQNQSSNLPANSNDKILSRIQQINLKDQIQNNYHINTKAQINKNIAQSNIQKFGLDDPITTHNRFISPSQTNIMKVHSRIQPTNLIQKTQIISHIEQLDLNPIDNLRTVIKF